MNKNNDLHVVRRRLLAAGAVLPALAWTSAVCAQAQARMRRIGLLAPTSAADNVVWHEAFRSGLRDLGWNEGRNISFEYRYAEGRHGRYPDLAAELVRLRVDVIVATATSDVQAAQKATKSIPIVMVAAGDPVASGLIESLPRPGGNVTGLSQMSVELAGKRLELLKEMVPKLVRVAVLWNPKGVQSSLGWKEIQLPARQLKLELHALEVSNVNDFVPAFDEAIKVRAGALFITPDVLMVANLGRIAHLAEKKRLAAIYHLSEFADAGGLITYGPDRSDLYRRAATFVDKILKGANPGSIPIEQPTKFELVVNMKTAKALGLTMPQSIRVRADRIIE